MFPLHVLATVDGIQSEKVLKVISTEDAFESGYAPEQIALLFKPSDRDNFSRFLGHSWGAGIVPGPKQKPAGWGSPWISNVQDQDAIRPRDVILCREGSPRLNLLYRRGSNSNCLFITEQCNSRCLMCSQPPKDEDDRWRIERNLALIPLIDKDEAQLGLTGGEPTLLPEGLVEILLACKEHLPSTALHILTNGRNFSEAWLAKAVSAVGYPRIVWGIPVYSDNADIHDYIVQAKGAFEETLRGLYHLASWKQKIEIRVVLQAANIERLPQLAYFIYRNLPFVQHVAWMGLEPIGYARGNWSILWREPGEYGGSLQDAVFYLANRGIPVSIYNMPLCLLPRNLWRYARKSISDWKNVYMPECEPCSVRDSCGGFFAWAGGRYRPAAVKAFTSQDTDGSLEEMAVEGLSRV